MKTFKILFFINILLISFTGCKKEEDKDLNPNLRTVISICDELSSNQSNVSVLSIYLNDGWVNVSETERSAIEATFNLNGNGVKYSYQVTESAIGTPSYNGTKKEYSGNLKDAAFIKDQKNIIEIIRDGSEWKLLLNGKNEEVQTSGTVTPNGRWQRYGSPNGYNTDLAIGNIPGEASNRVYMCEHPGSPSAGLYKGTIEGNTITWDASHNLPNAVFNTLGSGPERSLYFGVGNVSDAGKYKTGTWTNTCGELKKATTQIYYRWIVDNNCQIPSNYRISYKHPDMPSNAIKNNYYGPLSAANSYNNLYMDLIDSYNNQTTEYYVKLVPPADGYKRYYTHTVYTFNANVGRCGFSLFDVYMTYVDQPI
jgi:hypothetical protein